MNSLNFVSIKLEASTLLGKKAILIKIRDVSDKLKYKLSLIKKREIIIKEKQADSYKSVICHELRTPL